MLALALAACGGGASGPNTQGAAPPPPATGANTVTISPLDGAGGTTAQAAASGGAAFPASSASGVLDLAAQHPDGRVTYATVVDGAQGVLTVTRLGPRGVVGVDDGAADTRVGVEVATGSIAWVCVAPAGSAFACSAKDDAAGHGAKALATAARLLGDERLRQLAAAAGAASDAGVGVRTQADGVDASCVSGSGASGVHLLCVSPSGYVTAAEGDGLIARASGVEKAVAAADVARPATG